MDGILLIDKPAGWTSHDVVAKVRGILRQQALSHKSLDSSQKPLVTHGSQLMSRGSKIRVGHTGTLDPFATGLLILVVGSYTKKAQEFSKLDKVYKAELILGSTSTTGDVEGEITSRQKTVDSRPGQERIEEVLKQFTGHIMQTPHKFSAIKVNGQRAYALARAGKRVDIEPRQVTVYRLQVTEYQYPKLKFTAKVSSGTYIRSLAEDIGNALGTGAYLSALSRTAVGNYSLNQAKLLQNITKDDIIA